jgi:hypothetical protein
MGRNSMDMLWSVLDDLDGIGDFGGDDNLGGGDFNEAAFQAAAEATMHGQDGGQGKEVGMGMGMAMGMGASMAPSSVPAFTPPNQMFRDNAPGSASAMPPPPQRHITPTMFSAASHAAAMAASVPPSPNKGSSAVRRKSADFLDDFDVSSMRRSSIEMLTDALLGDDEGGGFGSSEDEFLRQTAAAARSVEVRGGGRMVPPTTHRNPSLINYTGTSSTDSRATSNEMINILANGAIPDPAQVFQNEGNSGFYAKGGGRIPQNNPVASVAAGFLNKLKKQELGPKSQYVGNTATGGGGGRRGSGNKHKLVAIAPLSNQYSNNLPISPPPMRKKQSADVEAMLLGYTPPKGFDSACLSRLDALKVRVAALFMEGIVFQNEAFMVLHLAGLSNEFLLGQLAAALEDRAEGNSVKLNALFEAASKFFDKGTSRMTPKEEVGGAKMNKVSQEKIMKMKQDAVDLRNKGNVTEAMKVMKEVRLLEGK